MAGVTVNVLPVPAAYTSFATYVADGYVATGYLVSYQALYAVSGQALCAAVGVQAVASSGIPTVRGQARVEPAGVAAEGRLGQVAVYAATAVQWAGANRTVPQRNPQRRRQREEDAFMLVALL